MKPGHVDGRQPGPEQAREVARELCTSFLAWAQMLFACVACCDRRLVPRRRSGGSDSQLIQELFEEVLAYGLSRLRLLIARNECPGAEEWLRLVKQECAAFKHRRAWGRPNSCKKLGAPPAQATTLVLNTLSQTESEFQGAASRLTREMFEQFCLHTGLGSSVLVGKGENLAALIFYIALHAAWSTHRRLSSEQVKILLRGARQCRLEVDKSRLRWSESLSPGSRLRQYHTTTTETGVCNGHPNARVQ